MPVNRPNLEDSNFALGPHPSEVYFRRPAFTQVCDTLRQVVAGGADGHSGVIVCGASAVGKTRLVLEALRQEVPDFQLLVWRHRDGALPLAAFDRFRNQCLALLLDDLHEFRRQDEADDVLAAISRLRQVCKTLVVAATSRVDPDQDGARRYLISLNAVIKQLARLTLAPMDPKSDEAQRFLREMADAGLEVRRKSFDGTPGSALLDLDRRTAHLRDPAFSRDALAVLKALALLRRDRIYTYPEDRVRRVAMEVFKRATLATAWPNVRDWLVRNGWLRLETSDASGPSMLHLPANAYLDRCVAAIYLVANRRIDDDFQALQRALSAAPVDAGALFALSDAFRRGQTQGEGARHTEMALACIDTGLAALDPARDREQWAAGQRLRGDISFDRTHGDRAENLEAAIHAYEAALTVYTRATFPVQWAAVQHDRGNAYVQRIWGNRSRNIETAIHAYKATLSVFTREAFPVRWAMAQNSQGRAYAQRKPGIRNRLRNIRNIERAIGAFEAALTVHTRAAFPAEWATAQQNLSAAYSHRLWGNPMKNVAASIRACEAALTVHTREAAPTEWASIQNNLGTAHRKHLWDERASIWRERPTPTRMPSRSSHAQPTRSIGRGPWGTLG
jgi:tetratricopeptide (TPR) repeat protein